MDAIDTTEDCPACEGSGEATAEDCEVCEGAGRVPGWLARFYELECS